MLTQRYGSSQTIAKLQMLVTLKIKDGGHLYHLVEETLLTEDCDANILQWLHCSLSA